MIFSMFYLTSDMFMTLATDASKLGRIIDGKTPIFSAFALDKVQVNGKYKNVKLTYH